MTTSNASLSGVRTTPYLADITASNAHCVHSSHNDAGAALGIGLPRHGRHTAVRSAALRQLLARTTTALKHGAVPVGSVAGASRAALVSLFGSSGSVAEVLARVSTGAGRAHQAAVAALEQVISTVARAAAAVGGASADAASPIGAGRAGTVLGLVLATRTSGCRQPTDSAYADATPPLPAEAERSPFLDAYAKVSVAMVASSRLAVRH